MSKDQSPFVSISDVSPSVADLKSVLDALEDAADAAKAKAEADKAKIQSAKASLELLASKFTGAQGFFPVPASLTECPPDFVLPAPLQNLRAFLDGLDGGDSSHPVELAAMKALNDTLDAYAHKVVVEDQGGTPPAGE
jgi:hypothetical protein